MAPGSLEAGSLFSWTLRKGVPPGDLQRSVERMVNSVNISHVYIQPVLQWRGYLLTQPGDTRVNTYVHVPNTYVQYVFVCSCMGLNLATTQF